MDFPRVPCLLGPNPESDRVWIIDEVRRGGAFAGVLALVGFDTREEAMAAYARSRPGGRRIGTVSGVDVVALLYWVNFGDASKPFRA